MADRSESAPQPLGVAAESDRRESGRLPIQLLVRDLGTGGSFEPADGDVALGGVQYRALHPPVGSRVEVRFLLPGIDAEIRAGGEVLRVTQDGERFAVHVRFCEIPVEAELAVARFLQRGER
jgi:hypothetical protein